MNTSRAKKNTSMTTATGIEAHPPKKPELQLFKKKRKQGRHEEQAHLYRHSRPWQVARAIRAFHDERPAGKYLDQCSGVARAGADLKPARPVRNVHNWQLLLAALLLVAPSLVFGTEEQARDAELSTLETKIGRIESGAVPESIILSPDQKRLAFFRKLPDEKWALVVDEHHGKSYDDVAKMKPLFSADSRRVAFIGQKKGRTHVVVDGVEGKGYDSVGVITFSHDSKHVAYVAAEGAERFVVLDEVEQASRYDDLHASGPVFSPDSRRLGYAARRESKWFAVIDGKEGKAYDGAAEVVFSSDSRHWAHLAKRDDKALIVLDGVESRAYDDILRDTKLVFTAPYTVEAVTLHNFEVFRVAFSTLAHN